MPPKSSSVNSTVPFLKELVLSSRIKGTQVSLGELLAAEAGAVVERSPADLREVGNYVVALEYGLRRLDTLPVSLRLVREPHERLMRGVRGDVATPGELRRGQNWIGRPGCTLADATYVPPPPTELVPCYGCMGALSVRRLIASSGPRGTYARPVRGHPSVSGRQWTDWPLADHPAACEERRTSFTASLPERLLRENT